MNEIYSEEQKKKTAIKLATVVNLALYDLKSGENNRDFSMLLISQTFKGLKEATNSDISLSTDILKIMDILIKSENNDDLFDIYQEKRKSYMDSVFSAVNPIHYRVHNVLDKDDVESEMKFKLLSVAIDMFKEREGREGDTVELLTEALNNSDLSTFEKDYYYLSSEYSIDSHDQELERKRKVYGRILDGDIKKLAKTIFVEIAEKENEGNVSVFIGIANEILDMIKSVDLNVYEKAKIEIIDQLITHGEKIIPQKEIDQVIESINLREEKIKLSVIEVMNTVSTVVSETFEKLKDELKKSDSESYALQVSNLMSNFERDLQKMKNNEFSLIKSKKEIKDQKSLTKRKIP